MLPKSDSETRFAPAGQSWYNESQTSRATAGFGYVAGNLFVYYEEGDPTQVVAPDVFVVKGVPRQKRRTYKV